MHVFYRILIVAVTLATLSLPVARAADAEAVIRRSFVDPWTAALQGKDLQKLRRLLHPKVLQCVTDQTREVFDFTLAREAQDAPAGPVRVTRLAPLRTPPPQFGPEGAFVYPVQPTYELQADIGDTTYIRFLAESNGSWYEVFPCPTEKGVAFFHENLARGTEQRKQAAALAAQIKSPLLEELRTLISQQRFIDAIKKYQQASGTDLTTAKQVIDVLREKP